MGGHSFVLDVAVRKLLKPLGPVLLFDAVIEFSKSFVHLAFHLESDESFPELALVSSLNSEEMRRISLRLLCPGVALPSAAKVLESRNSVAADCLLTEITYLANNNSIPSGKVIEMQELASMLLDRNCLILPDPSRLNVFLKCLKDHQGNTDFNDPALYKNHEKDVLQLINSMRKFSDNDPQLFQSGMGGMDKLKKLLLPLAIKAYHEGTPSLNILIESFTKSDYDPVSVISHSMSVFCLIESYLIRLNILQKHRLLLNFPTGESFAKILSSAIHDLIELIQCHCDPSDYDQIIDYNALWCSRFQVSLKGHCWDDAFAACLSNPIKDRQKVNFKRLVIAMF
jgi:hypothetical protein